MNNLIAAYTRLTTHVYQSWYAIPIRVIVGSGFMEHGYAKIMHGPESFTAILHALGMPAPGLLAWATILVELFGGLAVFLGAFIPIVSIPMAIVLFEAIFTVHLRLIFSILPGSSHLSSVAPARSRSTISFCGVLPKRRKQRVSSAVA